MEAWEAIPDEYRAGVDGLVLRSGAQPHPGLDGVYTLGECLTESYPSDWDGPDTTRSVLVLYYGSFRRLARLDPEFDWEYEIWETIHHELRHHLESLATEDALEDVDYAVDENFKRLQGDSFDPWFFRSGENVAPATFDADGDLFIEVEVDDAGHTVVPAAEPSRPAAGATLEASRAAQTARGRDASPPIEFALQGHCYAIDPPAEVGDVTFVDIVDGMAAHGGVCLVLVRRQGTLAALRRLLTRRPLRVVQAEGVARAV